MYNRKVKVGGKLNRFFVNENQIDGDYINIIGNDVNHIANVLRKNIGEKIEVVSEGYIYIAEIENIELDEIDLKIINKEKGSNEPRTKISLYQGLPKGSKMDIVVEKGTEIGVSSFYGIETRRTVVKIKGDKKRRRRIERWQNKVDSAGKQAMRDELPIVEDILSFKELLNHLRDEENIIVPYEEEENLSIKEALSEVKGSNIHILIGPEGGWDKDEILELKKIGGKSVSLGNRILRTETAGPVTAALVLYELGDI